MHILSLFPQLFTFALIGPFLLRVVVGIFFLIGAVQRYKKTYKWFSIIYLFAALCLIFGFYNQIGSILGIIACAFDAWAEKKSLTLTRERLSILILLAVISLSLLFTGPGFFAIDLPL